MQSRYGICAIVLTALAGLSSPPATQASDLAKEQRWADQIVDALLDGEAVYLNDGKSDFLSIYTESNDTSTLGMIVAHGTGVHPDWEQVVQPVRVEMATRGWNTLSIQMPILVNEATYEDYVPLYPEVPARIRAAEAYLLQQGMERIVIVSHSRGASMTAYYLANSSHRIDAFVAVGMGATQEDSHINAATSLQKIKIPVFDLSGENDLESVVDTADARKAAAAHNPQYTAHVVPGADHFFDDHSEELVDQIHHWVSTGR